MYCIFIAYLVDGQTRLIYNMYTALFDSNKSKRDLVFFFISVVFFLYIFFSYLLTFFKVYCINTRIIFYFFNLGFTTF